MHTSLFSSCTPPGRPSPVNPRLQYLTATTLRVLWEPPFTWEGYGITEYEVLVKNMTSGEKIVNRNVLGPRFELEAPMGLTASTCNELKVSVVAKTDLGASDPAVLPVWFPIGKYENRYYYSASFHLWVDTFDNSTLMLHAIMVLCAIYEVPHFI